MAAPQTLLTAIDPHDGQLAIWDEKTRHRIVRCGRRFGKSTLGIIETIGDYHHDGVFKTPGYRVGWFCPEYRYLSVIWRDLVSILKPMIRTVNNSEYRVELTNGSSIEAWTLNNNLDAGRSRKYHKIIVDEAGLIPGLRRWWDASASATLIDFGGRAMFLGTPNPIGPDFDSFFDDADHDPEWAACTATTFDNNHLPPEELEKIKARRSKMPDWLWLQEFMAIPCDAAAGFFPRAMITRLRGMAVDPVFQGDIEYRPIKGVDSSVSLDYQLQQGDPAGAKWIQLEGRGAWKLWFDPRDVGALRQFGHVAGADIGAGVGSSNTVFSVFCVELGRKIAEYASPLVGPEAAAREFAKFGLWLGGRFGSVRVCPETNGGAGRAFVKGLFEIKYPAIFSSREGGARRDSRHIRTTTEVGWSSSQAGKVALLTAYQSALATNRFINQSDAALAECLTYAFDKRGSLVSMRRDEDPAAEVARIPHGDRVIADALANHAAEHAPESDPIPTPDPDPTSFQARKAARQKSLSKRSKGTYGYV